MYTVCTQSGARFVGLVHPKRDSRSVEVVNLGNESKEKPGEYVTIMQKIFAIPIIYILGLINQNTEPLSAGSENRNEL